MNTYSPAPDITPEAAAAFNQANADFKANAWEDALRGIEAALAASPTLTVAAILRALTLVNLGRLEDASSAFADAIKIEPGNFSAWLERGNVQRRLGDMPRAISSFERAIQVNTADRRGHIALARILEASGAPADADKAAAHYHLALGVTADDPAAQADTHHRMAQYRLEAGNNPGALEALRAALIALPAVTPGSSDLALPAFAIQIDMAEVLLRLGLMDEAAAIMQSASQTENETQLRRLADLSYRFNFWQEALRILQRNADLRPESGSAALAIADMAAKS